MTRRVPRPPLRVAGATANFGRGASPEKFEANFRRVIAALKSESPYWILGCQELDEADFPNEHLIVTRVLADMAPGARLIGYGTHTPIIASPWTRVVHRKVSKASPGLPKASPARQVVEAVFEFANADDDQLGWVNTHMPLDKPRLQSRRQMVRRKLKRRIRALRRTGVDVAWSADMNELHLRELNRAEIRLVSARRDYIGIFPARGRKRPRWREVRHRTVDLTIDGHNAHVVVLELDEHRKEK